MSTVTERGDVTVRQLNRPSRDQLLESMVDADALAVGLEQVDDAVPTRAPGLKIVSRFGVGYDTVDIAACSRRGVVVGVTNGANDLAVAEPTMMVLLAVTRRTIEMDASVRAGTWMIREGCRWASCPAGAFWSSAMGELALGWRACVSRLGW